MIFHDAPTGKHKNYNYIHERKVVQMPVFDFLLI